jgi:hypothetical protein
MILIPSGLEKPLDWKNSSLGKSVVLGLDKSTAGRLLTRFKIWDFEKPQFLKTARTESGLSGVSKWTCLETSKADFRENPHLFIRYETVKECSFILSSVFTDEMYLRHDSIEGFSRK